MKMISNFTSIDIQASNQIDLENNSHESNGLSSVYAQIDQNNDMNEGLSATQLLSYINAQFNMLYKENHKRKYLIKEVSSYLIQK